MTERSHACNDLALDHIIHVVHNPEDVRREFAQTFGFHTVQGGKHEMWGTYNALCYFGLSYIEWLGILDDVKAASTSFGRLAQLRLRFGEGGSLFALRTKQMNTLAETWGQRGLPFIGPVEASRTRPDGKMLRWRMLFPRNLDGAEIAEAQAMLPFVIEWEGGDITRLADLRAAGSLPAIEKYRLKTIHVVTRDVAAWVRVWADYFARPADANLLSQTKDSWRTGIGDTTLCVEPLELATGPVDNSHQTFPGVCQIDLVRTDETMPVARTESKVVAGLSVRVRATEPESLYQPKRRAAH